MSELADYKFENYGVNKIIFDAFSPKNPTEKSNIKTRLIVDANPCDLKRGMIRIICKIISNTLPPEENDQELLFNMEVVIVGVFIPLKVVSKEQFTRFLNLNGVATLIPILRSVIINITQSINLPQPIILPLINVYNMPQNKDVKSEKDRREDGQDEDK